MRKKILLPCAAATALLLGFLIGYTFYETAPSDGFTVFGEREPGIDEAVYNLPDSGRININTAPAAELADLPGVGPALSGRIIAYREEHGPFESVEDLLKVSGIGEKVLARLEPYATVGGEK
jgi:competence protein ComEA